MLNKLIGNNRIKETLRRLIEAKRVPNALLFAGEEGIGKRLFALELAKVFVCQNSKTIEACDSCNACRRAEVFNLPKTGDKDENEKIFFSELSDIGLVRPAGKFITVKQIRDVETEANFRPFEASARFFLIDDADKMNDAAANALLKTLEEPPAASHIFLITSRPMSLLPTIRSRCQMLRFAPVDAKEIESYLLKTKKFAPDDAELIARLSRGSLGYALEIDLEKFRVQREAMQKVLESLLMKKDRAALLRTAEEMNDAKNKDVYENYLEILETLIHDVWALHLGAGEEAIVNVDLKTGLQRLAEKADSRKLAAWLSEIENMRESFAVNINRKIATDALFMQMAN
ncbi:MAG TPA: DNA polymerase III subunit delta' [Pyrinomonadaceae bacterium]|nr:DNA polymerase III subunit delta' [Pyrinomonadaceae bacterium]